ncbi:MAG: GNAT family N-acetyltransferase [Mycobacterium sp.]
MTETEPILPRELTEGLSGEVRDLPPPPSSLELPDPYAIRLADPDADAEMIAEWMNQPLLADTWESAWPVSRWHRYLRAQLDGGYSRPFVASLDGQDGAYFEVYWAAKDSIATRYEANPYDVGVHAAVPDQRALKKGIVQSLLPYLVMSLLRSEPRCRRIMFDPDHRNQMGRKFCERAGCAFLGEHEMSNRRMALYVLALSPEDVPGLRT